MGGYFACKPRSGENPHQTDQVFKIIDVKPMVEDVSKLEPSRYCFVLIHGLL
jgi:hypothetical protein